MRRADWTPAVLVTASLSATVVLAVLLTSPVLRDVFRRGSGPTRARRSLAGEVTVWVGELAPGLQGVLGAVWGDADADRAHDRQLNEALALRGQETLGFYHLLLFNTAEEPRRIVLEDGWLHMRAEAGDGRVTLRSLPALIRDGVAEPSPALEVVLRGLGALEEEVVIPPGRMADVLVAFGGRVDLADVTEVAATDGRALERRQMSRRRFETLLADPDARLLEGP